MKRTFVWSALAMALVMGSAGCTLTKVSGSGGVPLVLNNPPGKYKVVGHFKKTTMRVFDYSSAYDVYDVVGDELADSGADALVGIRITVKYGVLDFLVDLITVGLARAIDLQVEGDLVKMEGSSALDAPPGKPVASAEMIRMRQRGGREAP